MSLDKIEAALRAPRPIAPPGFVWKLYQDASFLKPVAWRERERATTNAFPVTTYATSPEDFSETKPFELGLTVQVIRDSAKILGVDARQIALVYLKPYLDAHKKGQVLLFEQDTNRDFGNGLEYTYFRFTDAPPGLKPIIVHKVIVANTTTDSVHAFTFESPAHSWDQHWAQYGMPILSQVGVNIVVSAPRTHNNLQ